MATFTTVLALLAFLAAAASGQNLRAELNPIWIMDKEFVANHGEAKLGKLIKELRAVLQGLQTEVATGHKVSLRMEDNFVAVRRGYRPLPPTNTSLEWISGWVQGNLQQESKPGARKFWSYAGVFFVVSGEATGKLYHFRTGSVCSTKHKRVIMLRYIKDDDTTVKTMAQAIGLFLGIGRDVTMDPGGTIELRGACTGVGGYMDYIPFFGPGNHWTSCSKSDFKKLYDAGKLCLETY